MNVRTKIFILLGIVVAIFAGGLLWLKFHNEREFVRVNDRREQERSEAFDRFLLQHWGVPLATFVNDNSILNGLVTAIEKGDQPWMEEHFNVEMSKFETHAVWVYYPDRRLLFSRDELYAGLREVPVPKEAFDQVLGASRTGRFFAQTAAGLMEFRGATIHPSDDGARTTEPRGYLFAARRWGEKELEELSLVTGNRVESIDPRYDMASVDGGTVAFDRMIKDYQGKPLARLVVQHDSTVVSHFERLSRQLLIWLALFALTILTILAIALRRWVWRPLALFSKALQTEKLELLRPLEKERCEVGLLARLIRAFFLQRENLLEETRGRRITEKALVESSEQLRHAHKMEAVGRLAGGVAHDFNNLLTVIIGYAGMLRARLKQNAEAVNDTDAILKAGDQAAALTRQLLAFSRKQVLHPRVMDVNELLNATEKLLCRVIGEHIELRVRPEAAQGRVRADTTQLQQVMMNLVVNARDAMPTGGMLTISSADTLIPEKTRMHGCTLAAGRYVTIEVTDTGIGMDEETQARIFEPFYTTKAAGEGTGLGLATVYGIVRQSGGTIAVESAEGTGTTFYVHLPAVDEEVEEEKQPVHLPLMSRNSEMVLVVEDDHAVRELMCGVLEEHGYHVLAAADGLAGLTLASEFPGTLNLLITDVVMPKKSGLEVAKELRRRWPALRVLFVTGYVDEQVQNEISQCDYAEILEKPFTPETLARGARELLDCPVEPPARDTEDENAAATAA